jgi:hypothetical protein
MTHHLLKVQPFQSSHFYSPYPTLPPYKKKYPCSFISIERKFADSWAISDSADYLLRSDGVATKSAGIFMFIFHLSRLPLSPSFPSFMLQRENYVTSFFQMPHILFHFVLHSSPDRYAHKVLC